MIFICPYSYTVKLSHLMLAASSFSDSGTRKVTLAFYPFRNATKSKISAARIERRQSEIVNKALIFFEFELGESPNLQKRENNRLYLLSTKANYYNLHVVVVAVIKY